MNQHAADCGHKAFRRTSRMSRRRSTSGLKGMTEDLLRSKRLQHVQPHWIPSMAHPLQPAPPLVQPPSASSSSASMVQVKPAPYNRNPSTASASMTDPWAEAKKKQQR